MTKWETFKAKRTHQRRVETAIKKELTAGGLVLLALLLTGCAA